MSTIIKFCLLNNEEMYQEEARLKDLESTREIQGSRRSDRKKKTMSQVRYFFIPFNGKPGCHT